MKDFTTAYPETVPLDPYKRVNYTHGLVLGVDEFLQEELYLLERDRLHNRALHGYGTGYGLAISVQASDRGPEVLVKAGLGISPRGRQIRVPQDQKAPLDAWLTRNGEKVEEAFGSPPSGPLSLYLTLCPRHCKTDRVPIPSGPCQSLDETTAPSRIADDFRLRIDTRAPSQEEEGGIRKLAALLGRIRISATEPGLSRERLELLVRNVPDDGSPPIESPPGPYLYLHPTTAREYLRGALKVWVTEVRPALLKGANDPKVTTDQDCVLLCRLQCEVRYTELGYRVDGEVQIDETERPFLLSTRHLQEQLGSSLVAAPTSGMVKTLLLPATSGVRVSGSGSMQTLGGAEPVLMMQEGSDWAFALPTLADRVSGMPLWVRLFWTFDGAGAVPEIDVTWRVLSRFCPPEPGVAISAADVPFTEADFPAQAPKAQEARLQVTDLMELPAPPGTGDYLATLRVRVVEASPPASVTYYLLRLELSYIGA